MTSLALAWALLGSPPAAATPPAPWRLIDRPDVHLGLRPALELDGPAPFRLAAGLTVRLSLRSLP